MANHKSSKKRILVTIKKNAINTARRSAVKTETKKALAAIDVATASRSRISCPVGCVWDMRRET